jgi:predicted acyltransferase
VVELLLFAAIAFGIWRGGRRPRRKPRPELSSDRLVSLDVFRGVTIAAMVLVNEPGSWDAIYPQLRHAEWNGATVADWIFPFFLFIVGVSIPYAFAKYRDSDRRLRVYLKVARRTLILFSLGLFLNVFPIYNLWTGAWFDPSHVRIMGVLQRIAICYAIAALVFLHTRWRVQAAIVAVLLLGYSLLMTVVHVPGCEATNAADAACNLAGYVDVAVLGREHMWSQAQLVDPEGILSTLGAIASTLIGIIVGGRLKGSSVPTPSNDGNGSAPAKDGVARILGAGAALTVLGLIWSVAFPLNKSLWTGSYVLYTAGLATVFLAVLHWLIDIKGWRRWSLPFEIFGTNAIALYVGSSLFGMTLNVVELDLGETTQTLQERIFGAWFLPYSDAVAASLVYSAAFLLLWLLIIALLYRRRIFLKV